MFDDIYIDFSKACRVDTEEVMEALAIDVDIILDCYHESIVTNDIVLIPFYRCTLPRNRYPPNRLYNDILTALQKKEQSHLLLEIMPLIDSYLEYMCKN
jgi:hypothetical protein